MVEPDPLVSTIAATVRAAPTVAALVAAAPGQVTASLPSPGVPGVYLDDDLVEVHVAVVYGPPLVDISRDLDGLVRPLLAGRRLQIHIEDIQLPGEDLSAPTAPPQITTTPRTETTS